ncbi:hypothetical protein ACP4OV_008862 [Aristida adscensionis]
MGGPRALLVVLAAALLAAAPVAADMGALTAICQGTKFPELCTETAGKQLENYPTVDALTVLKMQVDALDTRTASAREHVAEAAKTATPGARAALELCDKLYLDVQDNLGACRRAIGFKDATTIRATMGMAAQDMQNCDEQFRQVGEPNPMQVFDQSLGDMVENCRYLSNMI